MASVAACAFESFTSGEQVDVRGERWTVLRTTAHTDCVSVRLAGSGASNRGITRTLLVPFDRPRRCHVEPRVKVVRRRRWMHDVRRVLSATHPVGALTALTNRAVDVLSFQLEPALAMLRHGRLRILIADAVGLGKTIQAGIVLAQLDRDQHDMRALVLTPAGLRGQWRRELQARFSLSSTFADSAWLAEAGRTLPPDVNPWSLPGIYVTSLDLVKRPEVGRALEDVIWDVLVVDEAHGLGPRTARLKAAGAAASRARRVILLTATPPDGEPVHLDALLSVGALDDEDEWTVFRRSRADAGLPSSRKSVLMAVRPSRLERRMHLLLNRYTSLLWDAAAGRADAVGKLAAIVLRKRALSSARSLADSVQRRLILLQSVEAPLQHQLLLPLDDEDAVGDEVADEVLGAPGLDDQRREAALLKQLLDAADRAAADESKVRFVRRFLSRVREPAIVFTEYRDTLQRLSMSFRSWRPLLLHGGMTVAEREAVQREFATQGSLLLATDAASEGLNLHQRCRLVVHFELPWTPLRLEQRTGRVDRLGQDRKVHEVMLAARHTAERLVLAPLVRRARAAAAAADRAPLAWLSDGMVANMIVGRKQRQRDESVLPGIRGTRVYSAEGTAEASRLLTARRLYLQDDREHRPAIVIAAGRVCARVTVIIRLALHAPDGSTVAAELLPVELRLSEVPSSRSAAIEAWVRLLKQDHELLQRVQHHLTGRIAEWTTQRTRLMEALASRERMMARLTEPASRRLVQAGLFDRRALAAAEARDRSAVALLEDASVRLTALASRELRPQITVVAVAAGVAPFS